ncbi:ABC transporter ATP-binding protein [Labrenzia sp. CE80]|uniref:ABC transporter ATP-binding protein n=1 Tax=Labrenzia sp. CE80 TaxID=1788986 RepID=UPI00129BD8B2|nr:ABC transporter ATP-binding protein [Labrenzia sp. CE80]
MTGPLLEVEDLRVSFGGFEAVKGLSFELGARETLALVGESGSGKSATALSILRLIEREGGRITSGAVLLDNDRRKTDLRHLPEDALTGVRGNQISMVFQEPMTSLNPVLKIGDQVSEVFIRHRGMSKRDALTAANQGLDEVRIPEPARRLSQYPHELSGGLRQRVMIAMALACRPKVLIADEPTTALDVTTQAEILRLIKSLQDEIGMGVLFITHDMGVVAEIADRVVLLRHGEKVEEAPVGDLFTRPQAPYTQRLMAATPKLGEGSTTRDAGLETVLSVDNLSTRFAKSKSLFRKADVGTLAVDGVSLTVRKGETLGLVGESGCGKSTLARSILRLIEPESGRVKVSGQLLTGLPPRELRASRKNVQMVFQDPYASLNPRLSIKALITEPARIHGMVQAREIRDLAASLVSRVGLEEDAIDRFPHQFSGGQRQRLCIARALSVSPKLIIADEAVSALDVSIACQITDLMLDLQQRDGLSFLFISHDIAVVERVSHRIAVMYKGKIVETGSWEDVLRRPKHAYTKKLLAAVPSPDPAGRRLLDDRLEHQGIAV